MSKKAPLKIILDWFKKNKMEPLPFQLDAWKEILKGSSGLISVPTGAGKTYAAYWGALAEIITQPGEGTQILYLSPLRALARDLSGTLARPIQDLGLPYKVEMRTGDTAASVRKKQIKNPPEILISTPESLAIMLSDPESQDRFKSLRTIIIDEWHELLGSKRGVLLELSLAHMKKVCPDIKIWGLTATVGNLTEAAQVCVGIDRKPVIISYQMEREVILETILPDTLQQLPWAGQLGLRMFPFLYEKLSWDHSTLIFTNTRSQAERWHQALCDVEPEKKEKIALHHSSLEREEREKVENGVKDGSICWIVCTSSMDLGVDFAAVEKVFQIGSPKSIARLIQRAGRSSHKPLVPCRLSIIPTHALDVVEIRAYRKALAEKIVEMRRPLLKCYDVLLQHMLTCAIGGGFSKEEFWNEIKTTFAYSQLSREEYEQCLQMLQSGGNALEAYPEFHKLHFENERYFVDDKKIIQRHRMNIGTIPSDPHVKVQLAKGSFLGSVEEAFIAGLNPGDLFLFGGRALELIQYRDFVAYVRLAKSGAHKSATWMGGRLPFSSDLGWAVRQTMEENESGYPEQTFIKQILHLQEKLSHIPGPNEVLIESIKSREGWHLLVYTFEGKIINKGLALIIAYRLSEQRKNTFTISSNDYGFEIVGRDPFDEKSINNLLFAPEGLEEELSQIVNIHELSKGFFRDIARIAGLTFQRYPGFEKRQRQLQMTTGLLFEVFSKFDPSNLLLKQAREEVMLREFDLERLRAVLNRIYQSKIILKNPVRYTPFGLPLMIERVSGHVTTEKLADRIEKIKKSWKTK